MNEETTISYLFKADTKGVETALKSLNKQADSISKNLVAAFEDITIKGRAVEDVFRSLTLSLSQKAFKSAISPIETGLSNTLGFDAGGILGSLLGFAKGGAFAGRGSGGVINSPIGFATGGGQFGIAGEAGPEAILPLARGANGELGVKSSGSAPINITVNIAATDMNSFRRSEGEIAASLQRIVARGTRNL